MNESIVAMNQLEGQIKALEEEAGKYEQAARECRAKRAECKQHLAELRATINDAKVVHAAQSSMAMAQTAQQQIEEMKNESMKLIEILNSKIAELTTLIEQNKPKVM